MAVRLLQTGMKGLPRRLLAAVGLFFLFSSESLSQSGKWFLCLGNPGQLHFFHDSQASECRSKIAVKATAFLTGGVNFGSRAAVSDAGKFVEERRDIYLPRGTSILVLDEMLNGKRLVYAWGARTFFSLQAYSTTGGSQKSYAWQTFDGISSGPLAITLQKAAFENVVIAASLTTTGDPSSSLPPLPQEIPSGRVVELRGDVGLVDNVEKQEVGWSQFTGDVNRHDLRQISRPNLDIQFKYYVGSQLIYSQLTTECGGFVPVSRNRRTLRSDTTGAMQRKSYAYGVFAEPRWWQKLVERGDRQDYYFVKTAAHCDAKRVHVVISEGDRQATISDGPAAVRSEEDFERYAAPLRDVGFSNEEIFFIVSRTVTGKK